MSDSREVLEATARQLRDESEVLRALGRDHEADRMRDHSSKMLERMHPDLGDAETQELLRIKANQLVERIQSDADRAAAKGWNEERERYRESQREERRRTRMADMLETLAKQLRQGSGLVGEFGVRETVLVPFDVRGKPELQVFTVDLRLERGELEKLANPEVLEAIYQARVAKPIGEDGGP